MLTGVAATWQHDLEAHYSPTVLVKARRLRRGGGHVRQDSEHGEVWWVLGLGHDTADRPYRVQVIRGEDRAEMPYATCTCPNGLAIGGRPSCYHSAAVLMTLIEMENDDDSTDHD